VGKAFLILFVPGNQRKSNYLGGEAFIDQDSVQPFSVPKVIYWGQVFSTGEKLFDFITLLFKQKYFQSQPFLFRV